jgi:hypothetical protein
MYSLGIIFMSILLFLIIFWIVEFIDLIKNKKINKYVKAIWVILFFALPILSAIIYWVIKNDS